MGTTISRCTNEKKKKQEKKKKKEKKEPNKEKQKRSAGTKKNKRERWIERAIGVVSVMERGPTSGAIHRRSRRPLRHHRFFFQTDRSKRKKM